MAPQYVSLVTAAVVIMTALAGIQLWRAQERTPRRLVRSKEETFRAYVRAQRATAIGINLYYQGEMRLIVRGDAIEVSFGFAPLRIAFGMEAYFLARDTSIEVWSGAFGREWVRLKDRDHGSEISVCREKGLRPAWNALITAGATPIGPPPEAVDIRLR
jgi:hypothetical protein